MAVSILSNNTALRIQRGLDLASAQTATSSERLSSGLRINKSADDAGGLSVSLSLATRTRILNRAKLNVNDAVSALEVSDGALESISGILSRIAEIAEQGANGSLGSAQRNSLQDENAALNKEIRRIAASTTFNGIKLLQGSASSRSQTAVLGSSAFIGEVSGDGQYLTYLEDGNLKQLDQDTGNITTLVSGASIGDYSASASGEKVAFISNSNINGLNSQGRSQVFLFDRQNSSISLVSNISSSEFGTLLNISADGSTIAAGVEEAGFINLITYNLSAGTSNKTVLSLDPGGDLAISISPTGKYVAFSDNIITYFGKTSNFDNTKFDIPSLSVTPGPLLDLRHSISDSGDLYFAAPSFNPTGQNPTLGYQIFSINQESRSYTQRTNFSAGISLNINSLTLNADASSLSFISDGNLNGNNPSGIYQAFRLDFVSGELSQTTNYGTSSPLNGATLSLDGNIAKTLSNNIIDLSGNSYSLDIETGVGSVGGIRAAISAVDGALRGIGSHLLTTQSSSRGALTNVTRNIQFLAQARGVIGSSLARLEVAGRVLSASGLETESARSRIVSADIAQESSNLIRNQIISQSSTSILAQANLEPRIALKLLLG